MYMTMNALCHVVPVYITGVSVKCDGSFSLAPFFPVSHKSKP